jgi:predicted ATP-dependent serine protease
MRLKEAAKLGFTQALMPASDKARKSGVVPLLRTTEIRQLSELLPLFQTQRQIKRA